MFSKLSVLCNKPLTFSRRLDAICLEDKIRVCLSLNLRYSFTSSRALSEPKCWRFIQNSSDPMSFYCWRFVNQHICTFIPTNLRLNLNWIRYNPRFLKAAFHLTAISYGRKQSTSHWQDIFLLRSAFSESKSSSTLCFKATCEPLQRITFQIKPL